MKIAIFLPNWLGDLVMATPALRAVRQQFPAAQIVGILRPHLAETLAGTAWLDEQWHFDPRQKDPRTSRWALLRRLRGRRRAERFDLALLLTNSLHTAVLAWLGGARQRVGYARDARGPLLTAKVAPPPSGDETPMVDYYLGLAAAVGCPPQSPQLELHTTETETRLAGETFARLGLRTDGRIVALNGGSAFGESKSWPVPSFGQLARRIATQLDHDVLVLCGPSERSLARAVVRAAQCERVFSLAGEPVGLGLSKGSLARCRLLVSTDSGPRHVAAALGKPVITLFGPTPPVVTANPTVQAIDLQIPMDCVPCRQRSCPLGHHRCMQELTVELVYTEVVNLLQHARCAAAA
jgi:heptosyltransferase-2